MRQHRMCSSNRSIEENVKELTHIITEIFQDNAVIDWTFKDDVKREMRKRIKRQLRASNCPSKQVEHLARQLMELAEVHYKHIAG
ncbi:type I restriction enzyme endonuclease domain-containing protein [Lentibacillus cibarius]|uniref:type I restriction enzyme endonuclease domain-containing protein n=1 Tax=Lentibacillus cibarius TaxID=2583219 RepID=UPI001F2FCC69|nr:type I restriction enzyme endonuclease domain-containing protein [Lentibacillus cibarius]